MEEGEGRRHLDHPLAVVVGHSSIDMPEGWQQNMQPIVRYSPANLHLAVQFPEQ